MSGQDGKRPTINRKFPWAGRALHILFFSLLLLTAGHASAAGNPVHVEQQYPSGPWGLGVVIPENSRFNDGSRLSWAGVNAVSLEVTLPNISFSDYPTLVVESLMAADGSVMQIAAGIYPGNAQWLAYGWFIANVQAYPQSYDWVLNSSKPMMAAGASISLSISLSGGRWGYRIEDLTTHEVVTGEYAATVPPTLKVGDQEVFALESYTTSSFVFAHMGNLTLDAVRINGRKLQSGWYGYGSWDSRHNPLFVVGGLDPPSYISLQETDGGTLVWGYEQWSTSGSAQQSLPLGIVVGIVVTTGILASLAVCALRRRRHG